MLRMEGGDLWRGGWEEGGGVGYVMRCILKGRIC